MRKTIPNSLRSAVYDRDGYECVYCGRSYPDVELEIDHVIPVSRGGSDDMRNLVTACTHCNAVKHTRLLSLEELTDMAERIHSSVDYLQALLADSVKPELVKITLYLTPSLMADVKDLSSLYGKSIADYLVGLIERDITDRQNKLQLFRELRNEP